MQMCVIKRDTPLALALLLAVYKLSVVIFGSSPYPLQLLPSDLILTVFVLDLALLTAAVQERPFDPNKPYLIPTKDQMLVLILILVTHMCGYFFLYNLQTQKFMAGNAVPLSVAAMAIAYGMDYVFLRWATE